MMSYFLPNNQYAKISTRHKVTQNYFSAAMSPSETQRLMFDNSEHGKMVNKNLRNAVISKQSFGYLKINNFNAGLIEEQNERF